MKNYLLRSIVLVQICFLLLVGLLIFMTDMIDNHLYINVGSPASELTEMLLSPFYLLTDNSQYASSFLLLLHSMCLFLFFSMVVGIIIGIIWYYIKKKSLTPIPWMADLLLTEGIFIAVLFISYLIIYIFHHFSFEIEKDASLSIFLFTLMGCLPVFLIGRWLWRRGMRLLGGITLNIYGIALVFVSAVSIYAYGQGDEKDLDQYTYSNQDYSEETSYYHYEEGESEEEDPYSDVLYEEDDIVYSEENNTYLTYNPFDFKAKSEDYLTFDKPGEYYKWNFEKFNSDFMKKILSDYQNIFFLEDITPTIKPTGQKKIDEKNQALHDFVNYLGTDSYVLSCFWHFFKNIILDHMKLNQLIRYSSRARFLLKIYYLNNTPALYEDIDRVMQISYVEERIDGHITEEEFLKAQVKLLRAVYRNYDVTEIDRDLLNSNIGTDEIRWAYSFWARRYKENNIPIVLGILLDVDRYVKEKHPTEYDYPQI
ncbi:MFS transporter [Capnocytophaga sp. G2]|uniref:MFS transporter n=1 Tax=Capnocytophaga sp. G2 TaxID=3110695 RepID=UPI002B4A079C|nr:MFS transporter [Capnocytophaga sp. G2]MEB3005655.1 MFS transporter [Capnocytophaga sp. G2]